MLSNRYIYDGKPTVKLNRLQTQVRNQVQRKVDSGHYQLESVYCAVCAAKNSIPLSEKDRYGLKFSVVMCCDCGLIFTNPRMTQKSYAEFYDSEYRPLYHGKDFSAEDLFQKGLSRGSEIAEFIQDSGVTLEGANVWEVGCGSGGILAHLKDTYGCRVLGCDFGSEGVRYGEKHYGLSLQVGDLSVLKGSGSPDIVIYSHVFEHILNLEKECALLREILGEKSVLYIEVPSTKNIRKMYRWDFLRLLQNAHTYHFTLRSLCNVLNRQGLRLLCGDEFVRSLFVLDNETQSASSDYKGMLTFLHRTEKLRFIGAISTEVKLILKWGLNALGLLSTVKRLRRK